MSFGHLQHICKRWHITHLITELLWHLTTKPNNCVIHFLLSLEQNKHTSEIFKKVYQNHEFKLSYFIYMQKTIIKQIFLKNLSNFPILTSSRPDTCKQPHLLLQSQHWETLN